MFSHWLFQNPEAQSQDFYIQLQHYEKLVVSNVCFKGCFDQYKNWFLAIPRSVRVIWLIWSLTVLLQQWKLKLIKIIELSRRVKYCSLVMQSGAFWHIYLFDTALYRQPAQRTWRHVHLDRNASTEKHLSKRAKCVVFINCYTNHKLFQQNFLENRSTNLLQKWPSLLLIYLFLIHQYIKQIMACNTKT